MKLALLARINKILSKSRGTATKTKVTYDNLNVPEKVSGAKTASVNTWRAFIITTKTILQKPVRQVSHFGLIAVILVVLLSGVPAPEVLDADATKKVDPFGMIEATTAQEDESIGLLELEIVAISASFISDDMANDVYKQIDSTDSESQLVVTGGSAIANTPIAVTESSSKAKTKYTRYVVSGGDTLSGIAQEFGVTTNSIKWSNAKIKDANSLTPGDVIWIPSVTGIIYKVKSGDTIESIAAKYKSKASLIIAQNDLYGEGLEVGLAIVIPNGRIDEPKPTPTKVVSSSSSSSSSSSRYGSSSQISRTGTFKFPTNVGRNGYYNGYHWWAIDIPNSIGTPIYASDSGRITTASYGWNGGYGNTMVIDHGGGFSTRYAHLSTILIRGGYVSKGQVIGYMGNTGRSTGPHLHFEILKNGARQNPIWYL